ncbi:MAG: glycosyltransferase [Opitutales bacterium]|nr:glycosyltransferase [Opitutales bacterium]
MRILQIVPLHDSYRVFLRDLRDALVVSGHEVHTLCRIGAGNTRRFAEDGDPGCIHFLLPRGAHPLGHFLAALRLRKVIRRLRPDIVHAHFSSAILTAAVARSMGRLETRWLATFQGLQFPLATGSRKALLRRAEAFAACRMDAVWVLTQDDAAALEVAAAGARVQVQQSPGFGCADRFLDTPLPAPGERARLRREAGFGTEDTVFIFIGRLVAFKGFHLAARAFAAAARDNPYFRWIVIGELDPLHPSGLSEGEWQTFLHHPAISWLRTQDDVLPWLDCADAMLFPTSREGMPVSVMEALARRLPVLTQNVRGCRELITEGVNGHFFEAPRVEAVTDVLKTFRPFRPTSPVDHLRRSRWIAEMREAYGGMANG